MKRNQLTSKLFMATLSISLLGGVATLHADPVDDARMAVRDAHISLDATDARLHDDSVAYDQAQAQLAGSRQHTNDLGAALDGESHRLADVQANFEQNRRQLEPLQHDLADAQQQAGAAGSAAAADHDALTQNQARLDGAHADAEARFASRPDIAHLQADQRAYKAQIDAASDHAVRRLSETREYRHAYDDNASAQREYERVSAYRFASPRDLAIARDRAAETKARLDQLISRAVDEDPVARTARMQVEAIQGSIDHRHSDMERDFASQLQVQDLEARIAGARAAMDADNARLAQAQAREAGVRAALDQRGGSMNGLADAVHREQDRVNDLSGQFHASQNETAGLEARANDLGNVIASDRAAHDQAALVLAQREQTLGALMSGPVVVQPVEVPQPVVVVPPPPRREDPVDIGLGGIGVFIHVGDQRDRDRQDAIERAKAAERERADARLREEEHASGR